MNKYDDMQELQDRFDELDNIVSSLDLLIDEITDKDIIDRLQIIKFECEHEKDELEDILMEEENAELDYQNAEFEGSV